MRSLPRLCKLLCLLLCAALLPLGVACAEDTLVSSPDTALVFTDSAGYNVSLDGRPTRVAVMLSSFADLWLSAGGEVAMTVGESVERGIVPDTVTVLAEGAGKTPSPEAIMAAAPDLVILSADLAGHVSCAEILREAGIPVALFRVESFADYLSVLKICTDLNGRPDLYESVGLAQKAEIDALIAAAPLAGKRVLFARASSSAVKAKGSGDHFAAAMLRELGAVNIADEAPLLLDGMSLEAVLSADPDLLVFSTMGGEQAARDNLNALLAGDAWQALDAVREGAWHVLPRELFHYKPNGAWAAAYAHLAALIP